MTNAQQCCQCPTKAVWLVGDAPLCLKCYQTYKQVRYMDWAQTAAMLNLADQDLAEVTGMSYTGPKVVIPPMPSSYNNHQSVTITNSTVGAVNLGTANEITVDIKTMFQQGEAGLAEALLGLKDAVLADGEAQDDQKNEMLDQIAELTKQANTEPAKRKTGIIKPTLAALKQGAEAVKGVAGAWAAVEPLLKGHFGIG